jgi:hypothetical protein
MLFSNCAGLADKSKDLEKQCNARKGNPRISTKMIQNR